MNVRHLSKIAIIAFALTLSFLAPGQAISDGGTWDTMGPMPAPALTKGVVIEDIFYVMCVPTYPYSDQGKLFAYNPLNGAWNQRTEWPRSQGWNSKEAFSVGAVNGVIYIAGGWNGNTILDEVNAYHPATDSWTELNPMPTARAHSAGGVVNGIFYVTGGGWSYWYNDVFAYDPTSDSWTSKAPMPTARIGHAVGVIDGLLYAVGGYGDSGVTGALEVYDPVSNAWTVKAPMPTARMYLTVAVVDGILYAIGGTDPNTVAYATVEAYDPATNSWHSVTAMPTPRWYIASGVVGGKVYVPGGNMTIYGNTLDVVEAFTPAIAPPTSEDQCKKGGWQKFSAPRTFKNQGDCVQFVNTGR